MIEMEQLIKLRGFQLRKSLFSTHQNWADWLELRRKRQYSDNSKEKTSRY